MTDIDARGPEDADDTDRDDADKPRTVVVVGPDGQPVGTVEVGGDDDAEDHEDPAKLVEQPAKVMRVGSMIKQLLEEVRAAPLDDAGRRRLKEIHRKSIAELEDGLAPELRDELERLSLPFDEEEVPSESELRIAQAQLVGWLEGLFHGIQAALVAQQMAARMQLEQMRRTMPALPGGPINAAQIPGLQAALAAGKNEDEEEGGHGQYL
ncbi:bacterial proteasome activator family protein [Phytomonospora endophytica]|uniref:Bacterial proteasome activator n=1 Tax=Phytomonospora endophytica TaxID=714109 RepID=A0A841FY53_9ACTN|nr:bacterial proteasome activator family protein [Phytomonospora endophytica]MBB6038287.1 hypothetical protein [Phytomonospora endophytica]GIG64216.1 hypothetical protein Pen01_05110 [Phytomonospora endophytica]